MITHVSEKNINALIPLMRKYQEFYKTAHISDSRNETFFAQFGESSELGCQFLFIESGKAVGFATIYFSFASSITSKVAVLNDLYTLPEYRGAGIGRKLIQHCQHYAQKKGAARLQWVTAPDNTAAQKLYDSLKTKKSSWYFYTL